MEILLIIFKVLSLTMLLAEELTLTCMGVVDTTADAAPELEGDEYNKVSSSGGD